MVLKDKLQGKCYADKGYISREMFNKFYKKVLLLGYVNKKKYEKLSITNFRQNIAQKEIDY